MALLLYGVDCIPIEVESQEQRVNHFVQVSEFLHQFAGFSFSGFLRFLNQLCKECLPVFASFYDFGGLVASLGGDNVRDVVADEFVVGCMLAHSTSS